MMNGKSHTLNIYIRYVFENLLLSLTMYPAGSIVYLHGSVFFLFISVTLAIPRTDTSI